MEGYRERQISWLLVTLVAGFLLLLAVLANEFSTAQPEASFIMYVTAAAITITTLLFYQLDTFVNDDFIQLKFGLGLIKKRIPINQINSVQKVRNKWWYGWGLRLTPVGWLWNIKGLDAVELDIEGSKRKFRIGTQYPDQLASTIKSKL